MKIQMLLPIYDKWDRPDSQYGVILVDLQRYGGELVWALEGYDDADVGRFAKSFLDSIDFLEKENSEFINTLVIKRVYVRERGNLMRLPYFEDDLTNTMSLETFKEHLKNGLYNIS